MTGEHDAGSEAKVLKWLRIKWSLWKFAAPAMCNCLLSLICYVIGWHMSSKTSAMPLARAGAAAACHTFSNFTKNMPLTGADSQKRIERKLRRNTSRADYSISIIQAVILIFATLSWGFADLANSWMGGP